MIARAVIRDRHAGRRESALPPTDDDDDMRRVNDVMPQLAAAAARADEALAIDAGADGDSSDSDD